MRHFLKANGTDWKLACVIILALQSLLKSKTKKSLFMIFWTFFTKILLKRKYLQWCRCNHFHFLCVNGPNLYLQHIKNSALLLSILFTYIFFAKWVRTGIRHDGSNLPKDVIHLRDAHVPIISRRQCIDEKVRIVFNWLGKNMGYNRTMEVRACGRMGQPGVLCVQGWRWFLSFRGNVLVSMSG